MMTKTGRLSQLCALFALYSGIVSASGVGVKITSDIADMLEQQFRAQRYEELWNFRDAKTLVMFCNGAWCGQSPANIRSLIRMGYPPSKIKWYRGGMQAWETLGLTTAVAESP
jgi:rhodanese-related sulfurtransferase